MPATKVQLTGGAFQDSEGNVLALGYLKMKLNQDALISGVGQICSGIEITINLDSSGDVVASPAQSVWGNDQMTPANSYYRVFGYKANGQPAWGPNNQQVNGSGGTFNLGSWTPNTVISWTPPIQIPELQVNGVDNAVQDVLNLKDSASVTWVDDGNGSVEATAATTELQVNGVDNVDQALLNFVDTASVVWTDNGGGSVSATASASDTSPIFHNWHGWTSFGRNSYPTGGSFVYGCNPQSANGAGVGGNASDVIATATEVARQKVRTGVSTGSDGFGVILDNAGEGGDGISIITLGVFKQWITRAIPSTTSDVRVWLGLCNKSAGDAFFSDAPVAQFIGFRYSSVAGDIFWQCVTQTASGSQTVISSGIAVDTAASHTFSMKYSAPNVLFFIDGVQVGSQSTNVPATSTGLAPILYIDNTNDPVDKNLQAAYSQWEVNS